MADERSERTADRSSGRGGTEQSGGLPGDVAADDPGIGEATTRDLENLVTLVGHFYRGQLDRETTWRARLDRTTNWAVLVVATLLTWTFSGASNPHYVLLIGALMVVVFLGVEAHRYRAYDVPRSRVRMLEEDLFAQVFDPSRDVTHDEWRRMLSEDLLRPASKVSVLEALSRRLRRVYLPLLTVLLAAWLLKLMVFQPRSDWVGAASLPPIPGQVVLAVVAALYALAVVVAAWPDGGGRHEVETARPHAWDRDDE
ncbi:hypothetical protein BRC81_08830 [Halobacteriales archaeon QS_1_68_20]|nr:MAG: hypothetical protein BRC81_08830 [Halobacteriales archaeon QS_1_68_20]